MKKNIISLAVLLTVSGMAISCDRNLDLANKYDNSHSSEVPDANAEYDPDSFKDFGYVKMGDPRTLTLGSSVDRRGYLPDGKISVARYPGSDKFVTYIGAPASLRVESSTSNLEEYINSVTQDKRIFGKGLATTYGLDDGGAWFTGVFPLNDGRLVAFYHAESHWTGSFAGEAYKSVAVTYSSDNGLTWSPGKRIISSEQTKPSSPQWSGLGDCCVVYNKVLEQYICYYSGKTADNNYFICMAASGDPAAAAGTWKKWDGKEFTLEACGADTGLGGENIAIKGLAANAGANPTVMWDSYLSSWVLAYHTWDGSIYIAMSDDGLKWGDTKCIIRSGDEKAMYPNLVGDDGDTEGGRIIRMYYSSNMDEYGVRSLSVRKLIFN